MRICFFKSNLINRTQFTKTKVCVKVDHKAANTTHTLIVETLVPQWNYLSVEIIGIVLTRS